MLPVSLKAPACISRSLPLTHSASPCPAAGVVEQALTALGNLAALPEAEKRATDGGAVAVVTTSMPTHKDSPRIQSARSLFIGSLSALSTPTVSR